VISDLKTVGKIVTKKPKTVVDLLAVTDVCIEASEARAQLLESHGTTLSKKKQDNRKVNTTDCGDHRDRRDHGNRQQQPTKQKERRLFLRTADVEKWCEIYRTDEHNLKSAGLFWITRR
jgi:hypothetical protein